MTLRRRTKEENNNERMEIIRGEKFQYCAALINISLVVAKINFTIIYLTTTLWTLPTTRLLTHSLPD